MNTLTTWIGIIALVGLTACPAWAKTSVDDVFVVELEHVPAQAFYTVNAGVVGASAKLLVDTGSSHNILTKDFIEKVGMNFDDLIKVPGGKDHYGKPIDTWVILSLSLTLAGQALTWANVVVIDDPAFAQHEIDGIFSPFASFAGPMELNFPGRTISVLPSSQPFTDLDAQAVWLGDMLFLNTGFESAQEYGGRSGEVDAHSSVAPVNGLVDTGSGITKFKTSYINQQVLRGKLKVLNEKPSDPNAPTHGLSTSAKVRIGNQSVSLVKVTAIDWLNHQDEAPENRAYIGFDLLSQVVIRLNGVGAPMVQVELVTGSSTVEDATQRAGI